MATFPVKLPERVGGKFQNQRPRAGVETRVKSFLTNHSKQCSNKRSNIKNGARRHPQHPQPRHGGDEYST